MRLKIVKHENSVLIGKVPFNQLVKLRAPMAFCEAGTIGYTIENGKFVVVAGAALGAVTLKLDTPVEILKSGTLVLEIT